MGLYDWNKLYPSPLKREAPLLISPDITGAALMERARLALRDTPLKDIHRNQRLRAGTTYEIIMPDQSRTDGVFQREKSGEHYFENASGKILLDYAMSVRARRG